MSSGLENCTQTHNSCSETIELKHRQELEMASANNGLYTSEVTHRSVNQQIKLATESILRQAEEIYTLLASRTALGTAENGEATGSRRGDAPLTLLPTGTTDSVISLNPVTIEGCRI